MSREPRFIVDGMLGHVAKWLRVLGYDVVYSTRMSDKELLHHAKNDLRIMLTSDRQLHSAAIRKGIRSILIEERNIEKILAMLSIEIGIVLRVDLSKTRCPRCGGKLIRVAKIHLRGKVPKSILKYHNVFFKCESCDKVYWIGVHLHNMSRILDRAERIKRKMLSNLKERGG